jgi:parallel beta-helix repeat protein
MRFLLSPVLLASVSAATVHLEVDGNVAGDGSGRRPVATVGAAVELARKLRVARPTEAVTIEFGQGRFELAETVRLSPADSGLTLRAKSPGKTILSGGVRLTGWREDASRKGLWTVSLPAVVAGQWYFHQLFVDGQRAQRARTPNAGYFQAAGKLGEKSPITVPFKPGDIRPEWAQWPDARLIMLMKWTDLQVPIRAVNSATHVAELPGGPRPYWMDEPDARYWVENVPDALDVPGEWYLDRKTGLLSLLAPKDVNPNRATVVAPRLREVVLVEGDVKAGTPVTGLTFAGLTFSEADYEVPADGMISPQSAVPLRGGFRATHAVDCRVEDCTFANLAGYAVDLGRGTQRWKFVGNTVRDLGAGGVRIGEPGDRQPTAFDACHSHGVTDNEIVRLGRIFAPGCGVIVFQSGTNRVAHNHIADLFYTGISIGWNWGYEITPCRENVIEFNLVERVGQGKLSDMGGFYTLGPQPGTVIRNNLFRDVQSYRYGGWALYTDEGSTGIVVENNVAYRCKDAGFHQHYGRDNVIRNNLLAWNENHSVMRTRVEEHRSFWFTNNVVIARSGTLLGSSWGGTTNQFWSDGNVWFDTRLGTEAAKYQFAGKPWAAWQARGQDSHSVVADPQLVDPDRPELGLKPDSPAFRLGFRPIDLRDVGPRPKQRRK